MPTDEIDRLTSESLISAFLDDEVSPAEKLEVLGALASSAELAASLEGMKAARDLVANLPRPAAPLGFKTDVMQAIRHRKRKRINQRWLMTTSAIAASLFMLAFALQSGTQPKRGNGPGTGDIADKSLENSLPAVLDQEPLPIKKDSAGKSDSSKITHEQSVDDELRDLRQLQDRSHIRSLLERSDVRRILVLTDTFGSDGSSKIDQLISETPRNYSHFGRTTVSLGIVVDPEHPAQATVFTLILTDSELNSFRDRLKGEAEILEDKPGAEVVTQLAEVGDVAILEGKPAATLQPITMSNITAFRAEETSTTQANELENDPARDMSAPPIRSNRYRFGAVKNVAPVEAPKEPAKNAGPTSYTVLVWVTEASKKTGS